MLWRGTSRLAEPAEASGAEEFQKIQQELDTGGARDVKMGSEIRLERFQAQPIWEIPVDKSVLEVFINDGVTSVTRVEYPGENDLGVSVFAGNGNATLKSLDAWEMKSIW